MKRMIIAATLFATVAALAGEARAAAFSAWRVANVPWGDTLNIRKDVYKRQMGHYVPTYDPAIMTCH